MSKTAVADHQGFSDALKSFDGDANAYRRVLEAIGQRIPAAQVMLTTTFPRGGSIVLHPTGLPESFLRLYAKEFFAHDGPTWQAVLRRQPVTGAEAFPGGQPEATDYYRQLMQPQGWAHVAAVRVPGPVFKGYPGALHLYRRNGEHAFTATELKSLADVAEQFGKAIEAARDARQKTDPVADHTTCCRQFVFDRDGRQVAVANDRTPLDERLRDAVRSLVEQRIGAVNGEPVTSDRVELPDSHGEVWAFRSVVYKRFPALGEGPHVFLCLQPSIGEWNAVKQADFPGDPEVARLIPTLKFMQAEFNRTPTLDEIAAKAHLSPFHFHRRFTELLGQTPKHFLLACQIQQAKRMLLERKVPLADIASECGFAHQSHFTSRFKQATGLTPTRWRRFASDRQANEAAENAEAEQPGCAV